MLRQGAWISVAVDIKANVDRPTRIETSAG
jgi:hypothetical protein